MNKITSQNAPLRTAKEQYEPSQLPSLVYLASLSPGSRRTMTNALNTIAQILTQSDDVEHFDIPWHAIRYQHSAAIRAALNNKYAFSTVNKMLAALRGTLKTAWKLSQMTAENYHTAASIKNVTGHRIPAGRYIPIAEIRKLLNTCDESLGGQRNRAVFMILYSCGLRRAELTALQLHDFDISERTIKVRGKRNKERSVPVPAAAVTQIEQYLEIRGYEPGALFFSIGNRNRGGQLTEQSIYEILVKHTTQAGLIALSPHDFRRTYISNLLDAGVDISTVQQMAGHSNVNTTARYDRRGEKAKRKAAELLEIP